MKHFSLPLLFLACLGISGCGQDAQTPPEENRAQIEAPVLEREGELADAAVVPPRFTFADAEQGAEVLLREDDYTSRVQSREAGIRARDAEATSFADYADSYRGDVLTFSAAEQEALQAAIDEHRDTIEALAPLLPEEILLVKAGSVVEGGLPHTRHNAIIFAGGTIPSGEQLEDLFLHELHHVLSRANPALHDEYFALIGFEPCRFEEPEGLRSVRLTNPDAPAYRHIMPLDLVGADGVTPFLYAAADYRGEGTLGDYFGLGLLPMTLEDGVCTAVVQSPEGLLPPGEVPEYLEKLGGNTGYIIHPEETLADNFVYWAQRRADLPSPELPNRVGAFWEAAATVAGQQE
jgi:hypothetical protein